MIDFPRKPVDILVYSTGKRKKIYRAQKRNELRYTHIETFHLVDFQFDLWCFQSNFTCILSVFGHI